MTWHRTLLQYASVSAPSLPPIWFVFNSFHILSWILIFQNCHLDLVVPEWFCLCLCSSKIAVLLVLDHVGSPLCLDQPLPIVSVWIAATRGSTPLNWVRIAICCGSTPLILWTSGSPITVDQPLVLSWPLLEALYRTLFIHPATFCFKFQTHLRPVDISISTTVVFSQQRRM